MDLKKCFLILMLTSTTQFALAYDGNEAASTARASRADTNRKPFWVNDLCRKYTADGTLDVVRPFQVALKTCPERIDYGKTIQAYERFEVAYNKLRNRPCYSVNLREEKVGATCVTACGGRFNRVDVDGELGIQDMGQNGKIWFDKMYAKNDHYNAERICKNIPGQTLPSKDEFKLAERRGFREALGDMEAKTFWTSTRLFAYFGSAYYFSSYEENADWASPRNEAYASHVRCVSASLRDRLNL